MAKNNRLVYFLKYHALDLDFHRGTDERNFGANAASFDFISRVKTRSTGEITGTTPRSS